MAEALPEDDEADESQTEAAGEEMDLSDTEPDAEADL